MSRLEVAVANRSAEADIDLERWSGVAGDTLAGEGITTGELGLTFIDSDEMADLNHAHMDKTGPTDVLAFPLDGADFFDLPSNDVPVSLGDVVVCPSVARAQAPEHCGSVEAELALLVIHGVLHVLGHDHYLDEERAVMLAREHVHMERLGFTHPEFPQ